MSETNPYTRSVGPRRISRDIGESISFVVGGSIVGYAGAEFIKYSPCLNPCIPPLIAIAGIALYILQTPIRDRIAFHTLTDARFPLYGDETKSTDGIIQEDQDLQNEYRINQRRRILFANLGSAIAGFGIGIMLGSSYDPELCSSFFSGSDELITLVT